MVIPGEVLCEGQRLDRLRRGTDEPGGGCGRTANSIPLGYFIFSLIGLKPRTLFTNFSEALKGQPFNIWVLYWGLQGFRV